MDGWFVFVVMMKRGQLSVNVVIAYRRPRTPPVAVMRFALLLSFILPIASFIVPVPNPAFVVSPQSQSSPVTSSQQLFSSKSRGSYQTVGRPLHHRPSFIALSSSSSSSSSSSPSSSSSSSSSSSPLSDPPTNTLDPDEKQYPFEAEVSRVMDIIINSLYSDRDVFLRELLSNAADACDKRRFLSLSTPSASSSSSVPPRVRVKVDVANNLLVLEDSGVGMSRDELVRNLGRIAESGTRKFAAAMKDSKGVGGGGEGSKGPGQNLIGQFGVGFYSAYLVADEVTVESRGMSAGAGDGWNRWKSSAGAGYTIKAASKPDGFEGESGTRITLKLKEDAKDYLQLYKLKDLISKYSEFIDVPIEVWGEKTKYVQVPDVEANENLQPGEAPKTKTVPEKSTGWEVMNAQKPIWLRPPKSVKDEEYVDFYKSAFKSAYDTPMRHSHFKVEGSVEANAVLYIPGMLPFELSRNMFDEEAKNLRLYVKRVFINDSFEGLMPRYLKFVRGVVDSDDLPLNVGREILQKSKMLSVINKRLVRKSLDMIQSIKQDGRDKYKEFWKNFGKYVKVGAVEDNANLAEIAGLCMFHSSKGGAKDMRFLDEYVQDMKPGQDVIYFTVGDSFKSCSMSPCVEGFVAKGYEVLYMTESLDEIAAGSIKEYKGFKLVDAAKADVKPKEEDAKDEAEAGRKKAREDKAQSLEPLMAWLEELLQGQVGAVEVSSRLVGSPAALVQGAYGMSPTMQRYMKAQAVAMGEEGDGMMSQMNQFQKMNKATLEINPEHEVVNTLSRMIGEEKRGEEEDVKEFGRLLYDLASLTSGYTLEEPGDFSKRVINVMKKVDMGGVKDAAVVG